MIIFSVLIKWAFLKVTNVFHNIRSTEIMSFVGIWNILSITPPIIGTNEDKMAQSQV